MGHGRLGSKHQFRGIQVITPSWIMMKKSWKNLAVWTNSVCALVLPDCLRQWQANFTEAATSLFLTGHGNKFTLEINHMKPIWII